MRSFIHSNRIVVALSANAVLLLLILIAMFTRENRALAGWPAGTSASTAPVNSTSPAGPVTVMPCQLSQNNWGCYVFDPQNQTLAVYQYLPGQELKLVAARGIEYDRRLKMYNTFPNLSEIREMVENLDQPGRAAPATMRSPEERYR